MRNIINITPHELPSSPNMGKEDTAYFANKFKKASNAEAYFGVIQELYKHGYEDGYGKGCKYGKVIKLVNM